MTKKIFKNFLTRKNFETLILSSNGFEKASIVAPLIEGFVEVQDENHFITAISQLFYESTKHLTEDALELLQLKHNNKHLLIQSNECIKEYLPQVMVLYLQNDENKTEEIVDAFDEVVKENNHLKRKVKKLYKLLKKYEDQEEQEETSNEETTATDDEQKLVEDENIRDVFF